MASAMPQPFEQFKMVYDLAYKQKCKGCTTYRPNPESGRGAVLVEVKPAADTVPEPADGSTSGPEPELIDEKLEAALSSWKPEPEPVRPERVSGSTYKIKHTDHPHAYYVTVNDILEGDPARRRPYEIFINTKNVEHYSWVVALTRMVSAVFRRGGEVSFVARELQEVFDPRGGYWHNRKMVPSIIAHIGMVLQEHMEAIGYLHKPIVKSEEEQQADDEKWERREKEYAALHQHPRSMCSGCGKFTEHKHEAGCKSCLSCGYSECG